MINTRVLGKKAITTFEIRSKVINEHINLPSTEDHGGLVKIEVDGKDPPSIHAKAHSQLSKS